MTEEELKEAASFGIDIMYGIMRELSDDNKGRLVREAIASFSNKMVKEYMNAGFTRSEAVQMTTGISQKVQNGGVS